MSWMGEREVVRGRGRGGRWVKSRRHEEGLIRVRRAKHTYFIDMMRRRVWLVACRWPATRRDGGLGCVPHQVQGRGGQRARWGSVSIRCFGSLAGSRVYTVNGN